MISKEQIKHLAKLARIELSQEEINRFQSQIDEILSYVDQIQEVKFKEKTKEKKLTNVFRQDKAVSRSKEEREKLLNSSSWREGDFLKIPRLLKKEKDE